MPSSDVRLDRLYHALSAIERAMLTLHAFKEDREVEPAVRRTLPPDQVQAYNRYLRILNATGDLSHCIVVLHEVVAQLNLRHGWLLTLKWWAMQMEDFLFVPEPCAVVTKMINLAPMRLIEDPASLRRGEDTPPMERTAATLIDSLRTGIPARWHDLRAVEIVLGELSAEFDGEDLLHPILVRPVLDEAKSNLTELQADMGRFRVAVELSEPPDEVIERVRQIVDREIER